MIRPALAIALLLSPIALAQVAVDDGLRAYGGEMQMVTKTATNKLSGSLGFSLGDLRGYGATLGGAVVADRLWFFASAERRELNTQMPATIPSGGSYDAKLNAQLGDRHSLSAMFRDSQAKSPMTLPSQFLTMRYTGILSESSLFNISFSQNTTTR